MSHRPASRGPTSGTSEQPAAAAGAAISAARDGLFDNETELAIVEHTTDSTGYTDLVFALFDRGGGPAGRWRAAPESGVTDGDLVELELRRVSPGGQRRRRCGGGDRGGGDRGGGDRGGTAAELVERPPVARGPLFLRWPHRRRAADSATRHRSWPPARRGVGRVRVGGGSRIEYEVVTRSVGKRLAVGDECAVHCGDEVGTR